MLLRYQGKRHSINLSTLYLVQAEGKSAQIDCRLLRLIDLPVGFDIADFLPFDGQTPTTISGGRWQERIRRLCAVSTRSGIRSFRRSPAAASINA